MDGVQQSDERHGSHPAPANPISVETVLRREHRLPSWGVFLLIGGVFAVLTAWSWRKWPGVLVDYGSQLYIPWQLASGKVMYRDVMYLPGGPLSQYFHALIFKLFGVSFTALIITNLCLIALLVCLLYRLFVRVSDQRTATIICLVMLCAFSFSQYVLSENYNYVCPYSYEAFHGLVLSVAAIACLCRSIVSKQSLWAFATGLCSGCVFLTKPDLFLALAATLAAGGFVKLTSHRKAQTFPFRFFFSFLLGLTLPVLAFAAYFEIVWNLREGLKAVAGSWVPLLTSHITKNAYYQGRLGLDQPIVNIGLIFRRFAGFVLVVGILTLFSRCFERRNMAACVGLGLVLVLLLLGAISNSFRWSMCGSALAPATFIGCVFVAWKWWKVRYLPESAILVFPLLWSVFALFLLAKMGLWPRIFHYGFYLGMPAAIFVVFLLVWLLPEELNRFEVNPIAFRILATVFIAVGIFQLLKISNGFYQAKGFTVGQGNDRIIAYNPNVRDAGYGYAVQEAVTWIQNNTSPSNTLAVLPEGVMVNYLTRRINPTPYTVFALSEIQAYGETNMIRAYDRNSPDYILLIHRNSSEFKMNYFGLERGYGYDMMQWIRTNYSSVWLIGHEPLRTDLFGIKLLKRNNL